MPLVAGRCRLCLKTRPLIESHIVPRWAFARMVEASAPEQPVDLDEHRHVYSSKQPKEHLLCGRCEQHLSGAEGVAARESWQTGGVFPLLRDAQRTARAGSDVAELGRERTGLLAFFAVSVLWRAHVSSLPRFAEVDLGHLGGACRRWILRRDLTTTPTFVLMLTSVLEDPPPRTSDFRGGINFPSRQRGLRDVVAIDFHVFGLHFFMLVGSGERLGKRDLSAFRGCCTLRTGVVLVGDVNLLQGRMLLDMRTSVAKGALAKRMPTP